MSKRTPTTTTATTEAPAPTVTTTTEAPTYGPTDWPTVADYMAADRGTKAAMRSALKAAIETQARAMAAAMKAGDMKAGLAASDRHTTYEALMADWTRSRPAPSGPDYAQVIADRRATARLVIRLLDNGWTPEGCDAAPSDLPPGRADRDAALAIVTARVGKAPKQPLRAMIAQVVTEAGRTMTVAEVCHGIEALTSGTYGAKAQGAVTAALLSKSGVKGCVTVPSGPTNVLSVRPA